MERLPLLVGARPRFAKRGALVHLDTPGDWAITGNHKDTVLNILAGNGPDSLIKSETTTLKGPIYTRIDIEVPGSEPHISVFAEHS